MSDVVAGPPPVAPQINVDNSYNQDLQVLPPAPPQQIPESFDVAAQEFYSSQS